MSGDHPKLQHYWDQPEYWKESQRLEETCSHSNSNEKPSANTSVKKKLKRSNNDNKNLFAHSYVFKHSYPKLIIVRQIYLIYREDPNKYYLLRLDLGTMAMKKYTTFPRARASPQEAV